MYSKVSLKKNKTENWESWSENWEARPRSASERTALQVHTAMNLAFGKAEEFYERPDPGRRHKNVVGTWLPA